MTADPVAIKLTRYREDAFPLANEIQHIRDNNKRQTHYASKSINLPLNYIMLKTKQTNQPDVKSKCRNGPK